MITSKGSLVLHTQTQATASEGRFGQPTIYITFFVLRVQTIYIYIIIPLSVCQSNSPATKTQKIRH